MFLSVNKIVNLRGWEFLRTTAIGHGTREKVAVRKSKKSKVYYMVKAYNKDIGELRSEVCASVLGKLFGFPVQKAYLCIIPNYKKRGFSQQFGTLIRLDVTRQKDTRVKKSQYKEDLIHGIELIGEILPKFLSVPTETERRKMYTLEIVIDAFKHFIKKKSEAKKTIWEEFFELIVFDALIGGTDRHYRNWGILINIEGNKRKFLRLAPAFDNGISLLWKKEVRNRNLNIKALYASPSAFRKTGGGKYKLFELCEILGRLPAIKNSSILASILARFDKVSETKLRNAILKKMPKDPRFESDEKVLGHIYEYVRIRLKVLKEILYKIYAN